MSVLGVSAMAGRCGGAGVWAKFTVVNNASIKERWRSIASRDKIPQLIIEHPETRSPSVLRRARISVSLIFLIHGILVSNWLSRIPAVQAKLHLSVGVLGATLLATAAGALIAMPLTSKLVERFGSARVTRISTL